jgi:hypothetical protein
VAAAGDAGRCVYLFFFGFCSFASSSTWLVVKGIGIGKSVVGGFGKGAAKVLVASKGGPLLCFAELLAGYVVQRYSCQSWKSGP